MGDVGRQIWGHVTRRREQLLRRAHLLDLELVSRADAALGVEGEDLRCGCRELELLLRRAVAVARDGDNAEELGAFGRAGRRELRQVVRTHREQRVGVDDGTRAREWLVIERRRAERESLEVGGIDRLEAVLAQQVGGVDPELGRVLHKRPAVDVAHVRAAAGAQQVEAADRLPEGEDDLSRDFLLDPSEDQRVALLLAALVAQHLAVDDGALARLGVRILRPDRVHLDVGALGGWMGLQQIARIAQNCVRIASELRTSVCSNSS